jgi:EAL domain-containing protein (putative c-di-GMP-specific phosphodiesterase class I)
MQPLKMSENCIMQDESFANSALSDRRESGVQLALDNFSTSYSCLSYRKFGLKTPSF